MQDYFYVVATGKTDVVLGVQWLHFLGELTKNYQSMDLSFKSEDKDVVLQGITSGSLRVISKVQFRR